MEPDDFYIGAPPGWLRDVEVPLFVSHRRMVGRKSFPRRTARWALDSGAFTEVASTGGFVTSPSEYVAAVRRYRDECGGMVWASQQDHLCDPDVLARSSVASTVHEAQTWTVDNYLTLRALDSSLPIVPVLQGWTVGEFFDCADRFDRAGVDLRALPIVGVGSVARRQASPRIGELFALLGVEFRLHGFGVKLTGLARYGWTLTSADSMAWSYNGRRVRPCPHRGVVHCGACRPHALAWRSRALTLLANTTPVPLTLFADDDTHHHESHTPRSESISAAEQPERYQHGT